jgi:elongation factor Ts
MATISAADVKRLREMTSAGMMECKKALEESGGDFDKAVEALRISGAAKAAKRGAERTAGNGVVAAVGNAMVELLCETDFVAKGEDFQALAGTLAQAAFDAQIGNRDALLAAMLGTDKSVEDTVTEMAGVIGEKIELGGVATLAGPATTYLHRRASDLPPQVGVLVAYDGSEEVARGVAMQIAAMRPQFLTREEVPAETVESERHIAETAAKEDGKPEQAIPKIVEGRVNAYFKDYVLLEQPSVVDSKKSVSDVLRESDTTIRGFARFEPGQS